MKKCRIKFEKLIKGKEAEIYISREQIEHLNKEVFDTNVAGIFVYSDKY